MFQTTISIVLSKKIALDMVIFSRKIELLESCFRFLKYRNKYRGTHVTNVFSAYGIPFRAQCTSYCRATATAVARLADRVMLQCNIVLRYNTARLYHARIPHHSKDARNHAMTVLPSRHRRRLVRVSQTRPSRSAAAARLRSHAQTLLYYAYLLLYRSRTTDYDEMLRPAAMIIVQ